MRSQLGAALLLLSAGSAAGAPFSAAKLPVLPLRLETPVSAPSVPRTELPIVPLRDGIPSLAPAMSSPLETIAAAMPRSLPEVRAFPALTATAASLGGQEASRDSSRGYSAAAQAFDGNALRAAGDSGGGRALEPVFDPPSFKTPPPLDPPGGEGGGGRGDKPRRPSLSFPAAVKGSLLAVDPAKAINGTIKRVRDFEGSRNWWKQYKRGLDIDILSREENVFGRPTTITRALTKAIGKLTREDFAGTIPAHQLQAPIRQLRAALIEKLDETRKAFNPNDPPVSLGTKVRVVKFKSYLDLYRETHGPGSAPEPEAPAPRKPLEVRPEGALKPLSLFLPKAVYLDLDLFEGPVSQEILSDIAKLQRTGVYFIAFSRKPYADAGSLKEKLISRMSSYQLGTLLPIRFMAVTDDGAVISGFPKGGDVVPLEVSAFSDAEVEVLRDAAQKASEAAGLDPRTVKERAQPPLRDAADEFPGGSKRPRAARKEPQVRFEMAFPKSADREVLQAWTASFEKSVHAQGMELKVRQEPLPGGRLSLSVRKTNLAASLARVREAFGEKFGVYLNPSDILVLSDDPALKAANPSLDLGALTSSKGAALAENALGLMLGEHRENLEGDLAGSASRMAQFTRDRHRYLSEFLIKQDGSEQNINFFSGHAVHSVNDWLVWNLQNGRRPSPAEYEGHLREHWQAGIRNFKPVGLPEGEEMEGWLRESVRRGLSMYRMVLAIQDRGEVLVGTEVPNFFVVKDLQRMSGELKRRYVLHTIFDFVALRPDPKKPGHATVVIYDFKTGPAQSRQKLDKDIQVLTYAYFAKQKWVGQTFVVPYLSGSKGYHIDAAKVEFIYNAVKQPTTVTTWDLEGIRRKIINTLNRIHSSEQKLMGATAKKPAKKTAQKSRKAPANKSKKA